MNARTPRGSNTPNNEVTMSKNPISATDYF